MKGYKPKNTDIAGRELCSSIMPCHVCQLFNEVLPRLPKDYINKNLTKVYI